MRILVINWRDIENPEAGGAEVHLHEIFRRLAAWGHEVSLLAHAFPGAREQETIDGIRVTRRGPRNTFNFTVRGSLRGELAPERFDVVVDDMNKIPFYTPLFVKRPLVVLHHHFFGASIFGEAALPAASYVYASEALVPLVYRRVPFVTVSDSSRDELLALGLPAGRVRVVKNAVDHEVYRPIPSERKDPRLIVYVGRIKRYKNIDLLLRVVARLGSDLPGVRLIVVGEGDYRPALERLAGSLGLGESVRFTGFVPVAEKVRLLQAAAVTANPSPKEGWGVTVIEANACGTPVVASNVPGLRDAVVDGETGRLVPHGSEEALHAALLGILQDHAERARLADGAARWARTFRWDDSAREMLGLLEKTAAGVPW